MAASSISTSSSPCGDSDRSGELLEGIDEAIDSLTAGEDTTFRSKLVGGDHAGEEAEVSVSVKAVKERELPDLDDEFAQLASEFDTLDELRADLVGQVERQKKFAQVGEARDKVTEALLDQVDVPVPQSLIDDEVTSHLEAENRQNDDEHRAEVVESTEQAFRNQLLFDAVAELLVLLDAVLHVLPHRLHLHLQRLDLRF